MAGVYQYKSENIRKTAANIREKIDVLTKNMNKLDEICANVSTSWKDNAASKVYLNKIEEKKENMNALIQKYTELATILEKNATRIENDQANMTEAGGRL